MNRIYFFTKNRDTRNMYNFLYLPGVLIFRGGVTVSLVIETLAVVLQSIKFWVTSRSASPLFPFKAVSLAIFFCFFHFYISVYLYLLICTFLFHVHYFHLLVFIHVWLPSLYHHLWIFPTFIYITRMERFYGLATKFLRYLLQYKQNTSMHMNI